MSRPTKKITPRERTFAHLLADGLRPSEAARKVFGWRCEPNTREIQKARDLARAPRIVKEIEEYKAAQIKKAAIETLISEESTDWDNLHKYAYDRLVEIRDNPDIPARTRFQAIVSLEKLSDPASDTNLIQKYINSVWNGFTAHCPCCHENFPLWKIKNETLELYRKSKSDFDCSENDSVLDRRLYLIKQAEKRKHPHPAQLKALAAPERHVVAQGSARGGKSFLMGMIGLIHLLIPGVEIWILARIYDDAESEVEYLENFLRTMFYPVEHHMYKFTFDRKTGEASISTKWGSILKVKSGKAKGSITGRELEAMLVAEPAWVDASLFEEVRARMSSRRGRIFAMGTPKGFGQFLGRMIMMSNRDMRTGKKLADDARRISSGCPWGQSIYQYHIKPEDNPEYVKSEIEAAKSELTVTEYAAEFEGRMVAKSNSKFPHITPDNRIQIPREQLTDSVFVVGIDQGERNFGSCILGWNGQQVFTVDEYFDNTDLTIKANLIHMNKVIKPTISYLGGDPDNWQLTIFDADPPIDNILLELEEESRPWKTEYTMRPKNIKEYMNWREETCLWANELAKEDRLFFNGERCDLLHDQLMSALIRPMQEGVESKNVNRKGWIINDPWRGEHVPDAWLLAMWTIYNHMLTLEAKNLAPGDFFNQARLAREAQFKQYEQYELSGRGVLPDRKIDANKIWEHVYGQPKLRNQMSTGVRGWYKDES